MNLKKTILVSLLLNAFTLNVSAQTSFAPLVEELMPTVVNISTDMEKTKDAPDVQNSLTFEENNRETLGSGFIIDSSGYIATNRHVVEKASKISVIVADGTVYDAVLVGDDAKTDIAVIKIEPKNTLSPVVFGNSDASKVGDWVLAIGNPFGLGSSVTAGIISAKARDIGSGPYDNYLQTDASINQGNSGGPMFNINGEVIGINTAIFSQTGNNSGVGFALPSNEAKEVIYELKEKGTVQRSWIGINLKKTDSKDKVQGFIVSAFSDENLSKKNHLELGDIILEFNGNKVSSLKDFSYKISKMAPDTEVKIKVWRNGNTIELNVKTEIMPEKILTTSHKKSPEAKGEYCAELGAYIDEYTIVNLDKKSPMKEKGVSIGDKIIKINNKEISNKEDFLLQIKDSVSNSLPLKFDIKDIQNNIYFIELNFIK